MHLVTVRLLTSEEIGEVYEWLRQNNVDILKLRRDFSDVWPLAVLLEPVYPRLINMINYPKRNRIALKMENWETFNFKVLSKLNLRLGKAFLEQLAKGTCGAIEVLIYELICVEKRQRLALERQRLAMAWQTAVQRGACREWVVSTAAEKDEGQGVVITEILEEKDEGQAEDQNDVPNTMDQQVVPDTMDQKVEQDAMDQKVEADTMDQKVEPDAMDQQVEPDTMDQNVKEEDGGKTVMVNKQFGNCIVQVPSKMILYSRFERVSRECQAKEAIIELYESRLAQLEGMAQTKTDKLDKMLTIIDDLPSPLGSGQPLSDDLAASF